MQPDMERALKLKRKKMRMLFLPNNNHRMLCLPKITNRINVSYLGFRKPSGFRCRPTRGQILVQHQVHLTGADGNDAKGGYEPQFRIVSGGIAYDSKT